MNKLTIESICDFSSAFGPSGMENDVLKTAEQFIQNGYEISTDSIKNIYLHPLHPSTDKTAVLLDAHSDEVGFMVQALLDNGCLSFLPLGGWDAKNIISCPVKIRTWKNGDITGIVSSIPPHFNNGEAKKLEITDLQIDVGASSKEECEQLGIAPGDFIVPDVTCLYDEKREVFIGKAFDCRIGCAALIQTLNELENQEISCNVMGVLSAQEEVGERGITCAVEKIKKDFDPKYAICFEGCPADDTFVSKDRIQTALKKGPMIRFFDRSMITNPEYMHLAMETAKENNIPLQTAVRKGGGTNGGILHLHDIPTIVIGIPVRYAHASIGYCSKVDFENAVALAIAVIKKLENC